MMKFTQDITTSYRPYPMGVYLERGRQERSEAMRQMIWALIGCIKRNLSIRRNDLRESLNFLPCTCPDR